MRRRQITNDNGRWFDEDAATEFVEDTNWDGSNHISVATGSQWNHESLYRTAGQIWILHAWSQWQGSGESYEIITEDAAARWLSSNGHHDAELPQATTDAIAALQVA